MCPTCLVTFTHRAVQLIELQYEDYGKADHLDEEGHLATDHGSAKQHTEPKEKDWVYVDPHVMATPVAAGIVCRCAANIFHPPVLTMVSCFIA